MPSPISDHMIYIVVAAHRNGPYLPERNVSDLDRKSTIKDIADGQYDDVLQIIECNPVEGICRDVTEDILREAGKLDDDYEPCRPATQEQMWDWQRGHRETV